MFNTKDEYYSAIALVAAFNSKCQQAQVGCVLVKDDRIVSTGYNGTMPNKPNCDGEICQVTYKGRKMCMVVHAEINAIQSASIDLKNAVAYVTRCPCLACLQALFFAGIRKVCYLEANSWTPIAEHWMSTQAASWHVLVQLDKHKAIAMLDKALLKAKQVNF
jgi:dCMP deaminase